MSASCGNGDGDGGGGEDNSGDRENVALSNSENKEENNTQPDTSEIRVPNGNSQSSSETNHTDQPCSEDNGVNVVFVRRVRMNSGRNYRSRVVDEPNSSNENEENTEDEPTFRCRWTSLVDNLIQSSSSDSSDSSFSVAGSIENEPRFDEFNASTPPTPKVLLKPKPKHKWFVVKEVVNRQEGSRSRFQSSELFQQRCYGSLHAVQRLELMYKLEEHKGCVNNLNFNQSGSLLASASDDRRIAIWDWAYGKCLFSYDSGHSSNVFQAKFLPLPGDCHIVSCARDGQVRLAVLSNTGVCKNTRLLAQHKRPTHKIATHAATPHVFLSAGEDALVLSHDVRLNKANRLMFVKEGSHRIGLYSIHNNPVNCNEFCVTGEDHYIRLYDRRKISKGIPLNKFCPQHLVNSSVFLHVTCAVFNYNGTEILGSFNDDDIYLFDTRHSQAADYVHKYEGHRNSVTVKSVNFFGPRSEFIVSGSDCGNIYFWDKHKESIVQWMRGDEDGVVNCLEPHPQVPVIATSGLDSDIKIWVPSCEEEPIMEGLERTVISNQDNRSENLRRQANPFDGQMRWLWRQIQRFDRRRVRTSNVTTSSEVDSSDTPPVEPQQPNEAEEGALDEEMRTRELRNRATRTVESHQSAENRSVVNASSSSEEEDEGGTDRLRAQCSPS